MKYKIAPPNAHCAVRIDTRNCGHLTWLVIQWLKGASQVQLARSLGMKTSGSLSLLFSGLIMKYCPEFDLQMPPYAYGDDRKPILSIAVRRMRGEKIYVVRRGVELIEVSKHHAGF